MGAFLETEKTRQAGFKASAPWFSDAARADGLYKDRLRPYCLPRECAEENLFPESRLVATRYFTVNEIKWHDGQNRRPSNHMCDSQICCVNFLFSFADKRDALAELLRPLFPAIGQMLPVEGGQYVAFEWIGQQNYLGEKVSRNGKRTRGANFTSADAIVMFRRVDGRRHVILIEWKYTESYGGAPLMLAKSGTDRRAIYEHLYRDSTCPISKARLPCYDALFYEPFYQLMRQQFLANEMEKAHELDADIVSLLHIAPAHNMDIRKVTSPDLVPLGQSVTEVWRKVVKAPDRFLGISTEALFGKFPADRFPELATWGEYISARYPWAWNL